MLALVDAARVVSATTLPATGRDPTCSSFARDTGAPTIHVCTRPGDGRQRPGEESGVTAAASKRSRDPTPIERTSALGWRSGGRLMPLRPVDAERSGRGDWDRGWREPATDRLLTPSSRSSRYDVGIADNVLAPSLVVGAWGGRCPHEAGVGDGADVGRRAGDHQRRGRTPTRDPPPALNPIGPDGLRGPSDELAAL
jgi:hypothetical protein